MDLELDALRPVVEKTLAMSVAGRERWCLEWARWVWAQEIEIAVHRAKRAWLGCKLRRTLYRKPLPLWGRLAA